MVSLKNNILEKILNEYAVKINNILGKNLNQVILYGSYARGDYDNSSDIDVMILVEDMSDEEISNIRERISSLAFDISLENDIIISTIIKNKEHFDRWVEVVPFYQNVKKEGVLING